MPAEKMMPDDHSPTVALLGGYLTANKGGAAMTRAVHDHIASLGGRTLLLTIYPEADRKQDVPDLEVVPWRPADLLLALPLALLMALARLLRLPTRPFARTPGLAALHRADLVVDVAGISFVDGRGFAILGYNVLMTGIPLLVGTPVVKASQAVGPFEQPLNRLAARIVLPRVHTVVARGERTHQHLQDLGLGNTMMAADLAFSLVTDAPAEQRATEVVESTVGGDKPFVMVTPSAVVQGYCEAQGIDYAAEMAAMIQHLVDERGLAVIVAPHSIHPSGKDGRMHDVPVCREVHRRTGRSECHLIEDELGPTELRALIDRSSGLVSSRFHAMISGLCSETPTLVLGWSHKYAEVLRAFELEDLSVDYADIEGPALARRVIEMIDGSSEIKAKISSHLDEVVRSSRENLEVIDKALADSGAGSAGAAT